MSVPKVLFLCTGNSARSQMAEGFLRHHAGDRYAVFSAGLDPRPVNPLAVLVMSEVGVDISGQASTGVREYLGREHFGYIVTVCTDAERECPIFPGVSVRLHWPFDDPAAVEGSEERRLTVFRRVRDEIDVCVRAWLAEQSG
jgi:arsenate reductase (thioredoxin)